MYSVLGWSVILGAYLLGSIPPAYLAGRWLKGIDLRRYGSGNVGGSNTWVMVSRWVTVPVGLFDVAKGAIPPLVARSLGLSLPYQAGAGLAAVAGHNWSLYLGFTGGRGIGTSVGVLIALAPREFLAFVVLALAGLALTRNVPLSLGLAMFTMPLWSLAFQESLTVVLATLGLVALVVTKRLLANRGAAPSGLSQRQVLLNRLLLDRDIRERQAWVYRRPKGTNPKG